MPIKYRKSPPVLVLRTAEDKVTRQTFTQDALLLLSMEKLQKGIGYSLPFYDSSDILVLGIY